MPLAMVVGVVLCRPLASLEMASANMLTPTLIAAMLFLTFCRIELRDMRLRWIHLWMLVVQFVGAVVVYYATQPLLGDIVAQGAMICVMAPIAMAAPVIAGMLAAGISGYFAVKFMLNFFKKRSLNLFAVYVGILGVLILIDQLFFKKFFLFI